MTVYAYYEPLIDNWGYEELIELFAKSWERQGWEVKVFNRKDLVQHPNYEEQRRALEILPSQHDRGFGVMCMLRYLPMQNAGGGLLVDTDLINYNFKPDMLPQPGGYTLQRGSGTYGSQAFYGWICWELAHWQSSRVPPWLVNGKPHWSDMVFLSAAVPSIDLAVTYRQGDIEKAPLVHYSNGSLYPNSEPDRHDRVKRILAIRPL